VRALGQPGLILTDEPPQLLVAPDLAGAGVIDHHLTGPHILQGASVTFVQRGEVPPDRISLTRGASLPAHQLHGIGEVPKPRHLNPTLPYRPETFSADCRLPPSGNRICWRRLCSPVRGAGPAGGHPDASGVLNRPYQLPHKVAELFTAFAPVGVTPLPAYCFPGSARSVHRSRQNCRAGHARDAT
jgi:hypothetical protein